MKILAFGDIHFHHTHRFSHITPDGYTVRELEHLHCANDIERIAKEENIDRIVFLGDLYQTVGDTLSTQTQMAVCEFVDRIRKIAPLDMLVGNHCLSSNTNHTSAHKLIPFKYWDNVTVYDKPTVVDNFIYMPYCTSDEYAEAVLENIENKKDMIVFSHLELKGINLGNGIETKKGVSLDLLYNFRVVLQGHYHSGNRYGKNVYITGSTQRLSFKDQGKARKNIIVYDTDTNEIKRFDFTCPNWLEFTDENIDNILTIDNNNYVKVTVTSDMLITPEIAEKLEKFKGYEKHIDLTRLSFSTKNIETEEQIESDDNITVIKKFIEASDNTSEKKEQLLQEGIRLLDKIE